MGRQKALMSDERRELERGSTVFENTPAATAKLFRVESAAPVGKVASLGGRLCGVLTSALLVRRPD